ncbi:MAG: type I-B CRISPR-associated endonuclease Cas1 [Bacteroidetes bacterium]|nr:MAG: type I-B CRISPR-associated endonuclease Cas1 [Bacteroidota bacterium]
MKKSYYLLNPGRLSRRDNTLKFTPVDEDGNEGQPRYLPVEGVEELYVFGSLDANSALYNFLGQHGVCVHFFNYYEHYTGSFMPRDYLLAGKVQVEQVRHYLDGKRRLKLARALVDGASFNMLKNLRYYANRGQPLKESIARIDELRKQIEAARTVPELMGVEGNIRMAYYECFDVIVQHFDMGGRSKRPPHNELNALISLGNMLCYTQCLKHIYHTQLNPTISFLHEPGTRRFSLALDLAEVFKPILVDRTIFSVLNRRMLQPNDFRLEFNRCILKPRGLKVFLQVWEERLAETIKHRSLNRKVSYGRLIRLECYKITKHILEDHPYKPFKIWW